MEEKESKQLSIKVRDLLALANIFDDYEEFKNDLDKFVKSRFNGDDNYKLYELTQGRRISSKKITRFYFDHIGIIDTINRYTSICDFINHNYDLQGNLRKESCLEEFYQYLQSHQDQIKTIIKNLQKMNDLSIDTLVLDEKKDFTTRTYSLHKNIGFNFEINYFENMTVIPSYEKNSIDYKTTNSNYQIICHFIDEKISEFNRKIIVNNLLFDYNKLPNKINKEIMFDYILNIQQEQRKTCEKIRSSVDLSINIDDLAYSYKKTIENLENITSAKCKKELEEVLHNIRNQIIQLQILSGQYNNVLTNEEPLITKELLEKEKKLQLDRIYWASIDID